MESDHLGLPDALPDDMQYLATLLPHLQGFTGLPTRWIALSIVVAVVVDVATNGVFCILTTLVCFLHPTLCSILSLRSPSRKKLEKWLIYWQIYALISVLETFGFLFFIPKYWIIKCLFFIWCYFPSDYNGCQILGSTLFLPIANFISPMENRLSPMPTASVMFETDRHARHHHSSTSPPHHQRTGISPKHSKRSPAYIDSLPLTNLAHLQAQRKAVTRKESDERVQTAPHRSNGLEVQASPSRIWLPLNPDNANWMPPGENHTDEEGDLNYSLKLFTKKPSKKRHPMHTGSANTSAKDLASAHNGLDFDFFRES